MSYQVKSSDSELSALLECCICLCDLRDCRLCPDCSHAFCRECVERWLEKHRTCPYCRRSMESTRLLKIHLIDQLLETVSRNRCPAHENRELLLACLKCQQCVCLDCWFSDGHVEHKEQIVPVGIAFEHFYQEGMKKSKDGSGASVPNDAATLRVELEALFCGKRDAGTLTDMLEIMDKLRIDDK